MVDAILTSTLRALDRPQHVVIAHFGSILPKVGLTEADLPASGLDRLAAEAARTGQEIEISERWRCPSAATLRPFLRHGVDMPQEIDGVDAIYAADHQVPLAAGPTHPREVRDRIAAGDLSGWPPWSGRSARRPRARRRRASGRAACGP